MREVMQPILYLVRGLPGSGKSSFVRKQLHALTNWYEADMYFSHNEKGEYNFDRTRLGAAHTWCQEMTSHSLSSNFDTWVSNTFTTKKELKPYFEIAKDTDSAIVVMTMNGCFKNVHDVPEDVLQKMKNRFEHDISSLYEELNM